MSLCGKTLLVSARHPPVLLTTPCPVSAKNHKKTTTTQKHSAEGLPSGAGAWCFWRSVRGWSWSTSWIWTRHLTWAEAQHEAPLLGYSVVPVWPMQAFAHIFGPSRGVVDINPRRSFLADFFGGFASVLKLEIRVVYRLRGKVGQIGAMSGLVVRFFSWSRWY